MGMGTMESGLPHHWHHQKLVCLQSHLSDSELFNNMVTKVDFFLLLFFTYNNVQFRQICKLTFLEMQYF